jgi:hypothetical protein
MSLHSDAERATNGHAEDLPRSEREPDEAMRRALREQGFILDEDAHGLRLSAYASRRPTGGPGLSPYDVVRLAAELEGGIVPSEERVRCPSCDAVAPPGADRCQWCSQPLPGD